MHHPHFVAPGLLLLLSCGAPAPSADGSRPAPSASTAPTPPESPGAPAAARGAESPPAATDAPPRRVPRPKELAPAPPDTLGTREDDIGLAPGAKVAAFAATTVDGASFTDEHLRKMAPVIVVFYRGGWCPYCNDQVRRMATRHADFAAKGIAVVMASADAPDAAALTKRAYEVPFPLVADPDLAMHEAFDVAFEVPAADVARLAAFGISLEAWSERSHHRIAVPSIFLVDGTGTVRWAHAARDYEQRPTPDQILEAVMPLASARP